MLDQGSIIPSSASHAASVLFVRKEDRSWRFCQDYSGLNAILWRLVEPLLHVGQLVDEMRGARLFTKLDLAMTYMRFRICTEVQYRRSFRVPGGQYKFGVGSFGLHGMSSVLMRYMHHIFGRPSLVLDTSCRVSAAGPPEGASFSLRYIAMTS